MKVRGFAWAAAAAAVLTTVLAALATLAPVAAPASTLIGPNWLLAVVVFWRLRAPRAPPDLLIFAVALALELLRDGPVGLETAALLLVAAAMGQASARWPAQTRWSELAQIAAAAAAFEILIAFAMLVTLAPPPAWDAQALRAALTVAIYPLVAAALSTALGIRRLRPSAQTQAAQEQAYEGAAVDAAFGARMGARTGDRA